MLSKEHLPRSPELQELIREYAGIEMTLKQYYEFATKLESTGLRPQIAEASPDESRFQAEKGIWLHIPFYSTIYRPGETLQKIESHGYRFDDNLALLHIPANEDFINLGGIPESIFTVINSIKTEDYGHHINTTRSTIQLQFNGEPTQLGINIFTKEDNEPHIVVFEDFRQKLFSFLEFRKWDSKTYREPLKINALDKNYMAELLSNVRFEEHQTYRTQISDSWESRVRTEINTELIPSSQDFNEVIRYIELALEGFAHDARNNRNIETPLALAQTEIYIPDLDRQYVLLTRILTDGKWSLFGYGISKEESITFSNRTSFFPNLIPHEERQQAERTIHAEKDELIDSVLEEYFNKNLTREEIETFLIWCYEKRFDSYIDPNVKLSKLEESSPHATFWKKTIDSSGTERLEGIIEDTKNKQIHPDYLKSLDPSLKIGEHNSIGFFKVKLHERAIIIQKNLTEEAEHFFSIQEIMEKENEISDLEDTNQTSYTKEVEVIIDPELESLIGSFEERDLDLDEIIQFVNFLEAINLEYEPEFDTSYKENLPNAHMWIAAHEQVHIKHFSVKRGFILQEGYTLFEAIEKLIHETNVFKEQKAQYNRGHSGEFKTYLPKHDISLKIRHYIEGRDEEPYFWIQEDTQNPLRNSGENEPWGKSHRELAYTNRSYIRDRFDK